jgi:hypothetical protein
MVKCVTIYTILLRKEQPYQQRHGDDFLTAHYDILVAIYFCGPITRIYPFAIHKSHFW